MYANYSKVIAVTRRSGVDPNTWTTTADVLRDLNGTRISSGSARLLLTARDALPDGRFETIEQFEAVARRVRGLGPSVLSAILPLIDLPEAVVEDGISIFVFVEHQDSRGFLSVEDEINRTLAGLTFGLRRSGVPDFVMLLEEIGHTLADITEFVLSEATSMRRLTTHTSEVDFRRIYEYLFDPVKGEYARHWLQKKKENRRAVVAGTLPDGFVPATRERVGTAGSALYGFCANLRRSGRSLFLTDELEYEPKSDEEKELRFNSWRQFIFSCLQMEDAYHHFLRGDLERAKNTTRESVDLMVQSARGRDRLAVKYAQELSSRWPSATILIPRGAAHQHMGVLNELFDGAVVITQPNLDEDTYLPFMTIGMYRRARGEPITDRIILEGWTEQMFSPVILRVGLSLTEAAHIVRSFTHTLSDSEIFGVVDDAHAIRRRDGRPELHPANMFNAMHRRFGERIPPELILGLARGAGVC